MLKENAPQRRRDRRVLGVSLRLCGKILGCVFGLGSLAVFLTTAPGELPHFAEIRGGFARSDAVLVDRNGDVIQEIRIDPTVRRLNWTSLDEVSPAVQTAVIAAEDKRFYTHSGADWTSLTASLPGLFATPRGASTITMQLVAHIRPELQPASGRRSPLEKLRQIRAARALERGWSKPQILEAYLNLIDFRGELQGIAAASAGLFGKRPHGLDEVEASILAALIRAPNARPAQVWARAAVLAQTLQWRIDAGRIPARANAALSRPYSIQPDVALAPRAAQLLARGYAAGRVPSSVRCTLDGRLQRYAAESLRHQVASITSQNVHDGAVLVVDNVTLDVLVYVANTGEPGSARYVDGIRAPRQAGSTLKPVIYALAFEKLLLTPASSLDDSPLEIPVSGGVYRPRNYDNRFHGLVTARTALASSLNVPAVKTLLLVGVDAAIEQLDRMGIEGLRPAEYYGPSLALGSVDVTLWDLVTAYASIANGGITGRPRLSPEEPATPRRQVLSAEAAFLIADILSDRESRSSTFTLESPLATRFWTAVKTGTSKDMRDNWCIGFSDRFTTGVWVGNFDGEPMWNVSGITGAAPVWVDVMNQLHRDLRAVPPAPPPGLVRHDVRLASGQKRPEWFMRGTESDAIRPASVAVPAQIVQPASGTVIAIDPDIPVEQQRVFFECNTGDNTLKWRLDGRALGPAAQVYLWSPKVGKHALALVDGGNRVQDKVTFEVRGGAGPVVIEGEQDARQAP
jgi:penicillin-binding protein 1C